MAATAGIAFEGTTLGYADTVNGSYTSAFEITDFSDIGESHDAIEMTHATSPDSTREFLIGLSEGSEPSFDVNYTRTDAGILETLRRTRKFWKMTLSNGDTYIFYGFIMEYRVNGSSGDKVSATFKLKISGKPDFTAGT